MWRRKREVCLFFLLENSWPLSPWGPLDSLSTCLGTDSLNTIQPSHLWMPSSPSALSLSQFQGFFNESFVQQSSHEKNTRASASASVLGVNIQGWSPLYPFIQFFYFFNIQNVFNWINSESFLKNKRTTTSWLKIIGKSVPLHKPWRKWNDK